MSHQIDLICEFGPFRLDPVNRLLLRNGEPVPLAPKAFDILLTLVENQGRVLGKDEMIKAVWPDSFVEEINLTVHVSALRKVLGDSPDAHRYIETVPRRGYRFVASVSGPQRTGRGANENNTADKEYWGEGAKEPADREITAGARLASRFRYKFSALAISLALAGLIATLFYLSIRGRFQSAISDKSIAVLPFTLISSDGEQYLGVGIADALITRLSNIQQIIVRPTSAVLKYEGSERDPLVAGRELSVDLVLSGAVQKSGGNLRVTVQLVRVRDGASLWGNEFKQDFTNILTVQDLIAGQVAEALMLRLTGEEKRQLAKKYTGNAEAYQAHLKGRLFWNRRTAEGIRKAIEYFRRAIELDPAYALAYAGLADCYNLLPYYGEVSVAESFPQARAAATKALELDDQLAEAHAALAYVKMRYDWDWSGAEQGYRRALELNSNYATAHQFYAEYLSMLGRFDEAIAEAQRARDLDPVSIIINTDLGRIFLWAHEYDLAIQQLLKTIEMDPGFAEAHKVLGRVYEQKGMDDLAISEWLAAMVVSGEPPEKIAALRKAYAASGMRAYQQRLLAELLQARSKQKNVSPYSIALVYTNLGDKNAALAWLEKALAERRESLVALKVDQRFDGLRADPRFTDLLRRVGLAS